MLSRSGIIVPGFYTGRQEATVSDRHGTRAAETILPRIGAHLSTAGGLPAILERAHALHVEAMQFFPSNPRTWRTTAPAPSDVRAFGEAIAAEGVPLFLHTIYLVNPASPDELLRARSAVAIAHALAFGASVGAAGVVTHVGSHKGDGFEAAFRRTIATLEAARALALQTVGEASPPGIPEPETALPPLLLESSAGQANSVGKSPEELARLIAALSGPVGVCIDTAHLFVAGYDLRTADGLEVYLGRLDEQLGLGRVGLVHLNDARRPLGSRHDQHENLGEGTLGAAALARVVAHPRLRSVPFVLEVPGFEGHGPDSRNLARAKSWRGAFAANSGPPTRGPSAGG